MHLRKLATLTTRAFRRKTANGQNKKSIHPLLHSQLLSAPWLMLMAVMFGCAAVATPTARAVRLSAPIEAPAPIEASEEEVRVLAATAWAEARSEGEDGMRAVAHVIVNRVGPRFGNSISEVALSPFQFSAWNRGDPNRPLAQNPDRYARAGINRTTWRSAQAIAREVVEGRSVDPTRGALFYHTRAVRPYWAKYGVGKRVIGQHIFYSDVPDQTPRRARPARQRQQLIAQAQAQEEAPRRGPRAGRVNGVIQYAPAPETTPSREPPAPPPIPAPTMTSLDPADASGSI